MLITISLLSRASAIGFAGRSCTWTAHPLSPSSSSEISLNAAQPNKPFLRGFLRPALHGTSFNFNNHHRESS
ncbi:hypothetical protein DE146DRAFT_651516 [Phaeosphaeria sp. MPI-PUGE-AT-0046c]|nr:hypothetical protein DE146DRAFT_651516 [Phaeosphaeria sp. MPI-PUGE-AT-0046c]